jgi:hypothetical protein
VTYAPPSGWVEERLQATEDALHKSRFHIRRDCVKIEKSATLRPVDRPYSSARCSSCAPYS